MTSSAAFKAHMQTLHNNFPHMLSRPSQLEGEGTTRTHLRFEMKNGVSAWKRLRVLAHCNGGGASLNTFHLLAHSISLLVRNLLIHSSLLATGFSCSISVCRSPHSAFNWWSRHFTFDRNYRNDTCRNISPLSVSFPSNCKISIVMAIDAQSSAILQCLSSAFESIKWNAMPSSRVDRRQLCTSEE